MTRPGPGRAPPAAPDRPRARSVCCRRCPRRPFARATNVPVAGRRHAERHVLQRRHVWEQPAVLEDDPDGAAGGGDANAPHRVLEDFVVEDDRATVEPQESGECAQERRLAGAVGPEHGDDLPVGDRQVDVKNERSSADDDLGPDAHRRRGRGLSQRPRNRKSTAMDSARSTRLSSTATPGRCCNSR